MYYQEATTEVLQDDHCSLMFQGMHGVTYWSIGVPTWSNWGSMESISPQFCQTKISILLAGPPLVPPWRWEAGEGVRWKGGEGGRWEVGEGVRWEVGGWGGSEVGGW